METEYKRLKTVDINNAIKLINSAYAKTNIEFLGDPNRVDSASIHELLKEGVADCLYCKESQELLAIVFQVFEEKPYLSSFLHLVSVPPKHQGKGLATQILELTLDMHKKQGVRTVRLNILGKEKGECTYTKGLVKFYSQFGFQLNGSQKMSVVYPEESLKAQIPLVVHNLELHFQ